MILLLNFAVALLCLVLSGALLWALRSARTRQSDRLRLNDFLDSASVLVEPVRVAQPAIALPAGLQRKLYRAGLEPVWRQIAQIVAALVLTTIVAALVFGLIVGALVGVGLPLLIWGGIEYSARRRMRLLSDCMIGYLERIRQLLTVGNSLAVALQRATENSPPIVTTYMASTVRRISNGSGVGESLERCAIDLDIYELHLLATAARTNLRFGGSMSTILRNIIENVRRRAAVERELRASTAEIRTSAWVLAALPLLVAAIVMFTNHTYAQWFLATETGHHMLIYAALSQLMGIWCMRLVVRTRY